MFKYEQTNEKAGDHFDTEEGASVEPVPFFDQIGEDAASNEQFAVRNQRFGIEVDRGNSTPKVLYMIWKQLFRG